MSNNISIKELIKRIRNYDNVDKKQILNNSFERNINENQLNTKELINIIKKNLNKSINEDISSNSEFGENKTIPSDQKQEEEKMNNYFNDLNVTINYKELEVFDNVVIWGGDIDGTIQFIYTVTPFENSSTYQINYTDEFDPENEDNKKIIEKIKNYYDTFYQYWKENIIQK